jgi:hypothetical protein
MKNTRSRSTTKSKKSTATRSNTTRSTTRTRTQPKKKLTQAYKKALKMAKEHKKLLKGVGAAAVLGAAAYKANKVHKPSGKKYYQLGAEKAKNVALKPVNYAVDKYSKSRASGMLGNTWNAITGFWGGKA